MAALTLPPLTLRDAVRHLPWRHRIRATLPGRRRRTLTAALTRHHQTTVSVTLELDTRHFDEALARASTAARRVAAEMRTLGRRVAFDRELAIVGGEARWYIRGANHGMFITPDPGYTLEEARAEDRDITVQAMLAGGMHPRWVAAYIRGWCDSYGTGPRDPYVLHTVWSAPAGSTTATSTAVEVSA